MGPLTRPARLFFVLKVPLCNLRRSLIYAAPCDRIVPMVYLPIHYLVMTEGLEIFVRIAATAAILHS